MDELPDPLIIPRVAPNKRINIIAASENGESVISVMTAEQALKFGKAILCTAIALTSDKDLIPEGSIANDAHFPVMQYLIGYSNINIEPIFAVTIPGDLTLTFQISGEGAKAMGAALAAQGEKASLPAGSRPS